MAADEQRGQDLDLSREHEASLEWVNSFNVLVDQVRVGWPDDFAGSEIVQSPSPAGVVLFKAEPPPGALAVLAASTVPVELRSGIGVSEAEIENATEAAHFAVLATLPVGTPVASEGSSRTSSVTTVVGSRNLIGPRTRLPQADIEGLAQQEVDAVVENSAISVEVVFDPTLQATAEVSYGRAGGVRLTPGGPCTSGFVVKSRNSPDLGIVTAGHCGNNLTQNGSYAFNFRAEYVGSEGDAQWMRSPLMMDAWFHYDFGAGSPVRRSALASIGQQIYKFGVATGRTTSTVRSTNACLNSTCNLVSTDRKISEGGDSGGPWYIGTSAYGTHVGSSFNPFSSSSYYFPIGRTLSRFGLNLCIDVNFEPSC